MISVVIPCYRVRAHIADVIAQIGPEVDAIYAVDDACPDGSGDYIVQNVSDPRVRVLRHDTNQGVGGAVMTGVHAAVRDGTHIIVKIDGDGQMDPRLIPLFVRPILEEKADLTKGNRFFNPEDATSMPAVRLFGNAVLSFFAKLSTGYWTNFDPTNGYLAIDARVFGALATEKIHRRYFFETDLLFRASLLRAKVTDVPMRAVYADEISNLHVRREIVRFCIGHSKNLVKRIGYNYFLRDFNVASVELTLGLLLLVFAAVFGLGHWSSDGPAATAGTVMVAALPALVGVFLLISFINFDVQQVPREPISSRLAERRSSATKVRQVERIATTASVRPLSQPRTEEDPQWRQS